MSTTPPKPGTKLKAMLDVIVKLEGAIENEAKGNANNAEGFCAQMLDQIASGDLGPDDVKFLLDRLQTNASTYQRDADALGLIAMMFEESAIRVRGRFAAVIKEKGAEKSEGESWTATVVPGRPQVTVDRKKLAKKFFVKEEGLDQKALQAAIESGKKTKGISVVPMFDVTFSLKKKPAQQ